MFNQDKLRAKFFYFSLEMSEEDLYQQFICHLLFIVSKGEIRISPKYLKSIDASNPVDPKILELISSEEYRKYFDYFNENVKIITSIRNPTGINKFMRDYARANGVQHKKIINFINKDTGEEVPTEVDSHYEPNDPDEYVFCIIDHISLIQQESGMSLKDSMTKLSADYLVGLRNKYRYIPVVIQQQAIAGEGIENVKMGKLKPSVADLGESKILSRDCNVMFGLFSPFRHEMHDYMGYSIDRFRDNIRFMEIIISREGGGGTTCPLFFDGAVDMFKELPMPNDNHGIENVLQFIEKIRSKSNNNKSLSLLNFKKQKNGKIVRDIRNVRRRKVNINNYKSRWIL